MLLALPLTHRFSRTHAAIAMIQRVLFIFWESPPSGFIKINFDGKVRDGEDGVGFVIQDSDAKLLAARSSHFLSYLSWERSSVLLGQALPVLGRSYMLRKFFSRMILLLLLAGSVVFIRHIFREAIV